VDDLTRPLLDLGRIGNRATETTARFASTMEDLGTTLEKVNREGRRAPTINEFTREQLDAFEQFQQDMAKADEEFNRQVAQIESDNAERIADIESDLEENRTKVAEDTQKKISKIEGDAIKQRIRNMRDTLRDLVRAASRLDAVAVREIKESAQDRDQLLQEQRDESIKETKSAEDERIDELEKAAKKRIDEEEKEGKRRLEELRAAHEVQAREREQAFIREFTNATAFQQRLEQAQALHYANLQQQAGVFFQQNELLWGQYLDNLLLTTAESARRVTGAELAGTVNRPRVPQVNLGGQVAGANVQQGARPSTSTSNRVTGNVTVNAGNMTPQQAENASVHALNRVFQRAGLAR